MKLLMNHFSYPLVISSLIGPNSLLSPRSYIPRSMLFLYMRDKFHTHKTLQGIIVLCTLTFIFLYSRRGDKILN
jgi:hypothetical protein